HRPAADPPPRRPAAGGRHHAALPRARRRRPRAHPQPQRVRRPPRLRHKSPAPVGRPHHLGDTVFSTAFARDLAERTLATFAEAFASLLIASGAGLLDADWLTAASVAGMTALVTLLKGVAAYK